MQRYFFLLLLLLLSACASQHDKIRLPRWLHDKIVQAERKTGSYEEVWAYKYRGQTVYLFLPGCCDRMSELYDEKGKLICKPSGGITGRGDGRCRKFIQKRKYGVLLWKPDTAND